MKLEMVCIQLCQGAVSVGCTDKPYIVDSVPDHMVVVAFQKLAAFIPVVVQKPQSLFLVSILIASESMQYGIGIDSMVYTLTLSCDGVWVVGR